MSDLDRSLILSSQYICNRFIPTSRTGIVSPLNIVMALGYLINGSSGESLQEILSLLHLHKTDINSLNMGIIRFMNTSLKSKTMNVMNTCIVGNDIYLDNRYHKTIAKWGDITQMSFGNPNKIVEKANRMVEKSTRGKISNILSYGDVSEAMKMMIISTLYVKPRWRKTFDRHDTKKDIFYKSNGDKIRTRFMNLTDKFDYLETNSGQILKLDCKDNFSLLIILPSSNDECDLFHQYPMNYIDKMKRRTVRVSLPKFKVQDTLDMTQVLQRHNVHGIFDPSMGLDRMLDSDEGMNVDLFIHKVTFEVDESGVEASAASVIGVDLNCAMPKEEEEIVKFNANHTFRYHLLHQDKFVLFSGTWNGEHSMTSNRFTHRAKYNNKENLFPELSEREKKRFRSRDKRHRRGDEANNHKKMMYVISFMIIAVLVVILSLMYYNNKRKKK